MQNIRNKNILIVEEDERMLSAFERTLSGEGATITATRYAGCALDILMRREREMDFVVTGPRTSLATGMTLTYAIRTMFPKTPVIVLAAFGEPGPKPERYQGGASGTGPSAAKSNDLVNEVVLALKDDMKLLTIAE